MSTPARKSGRQAKPTEKFKEYLYEREVPSKIEHKSSITGHIQASKEKHSTDATSQTNFKKRGRPRKSVLEVDPLKNKTNNPESEDKDNDTKGSKNKKDNSPQKKEVTRDLQVKKTLSVSSKDELSDHPDRKRGRPRKEANFEPQPECNSSTMTDTDSEDEDHGGKSQESGPRRSGRPPKLNKRLLSYLRSDEGPFGESGHLSKKRKENSEILSKKIKKHYYFEEFENTRGDDVLPKIKQPRPVNHEPGPAVKCVQNTSIGNKKVLGRLKSLSPEKKVSRGGKEEITDIKKNMISKLEELSRKMLEDDTNHFLKLASEDSNDLGDPFAALHLESNTEDLDDETSEKVLKWLVEEEIERQRYRRKLLESLKKSHEKISKSAPVVQPNTVSIEGHEFKVVSSPDKLIKRNNQAFKILPVAGKVTSVYDFIPSPPKTSKKGFDKENKKHMNIENEPRRSIRTPKTNSRLLNFLNSEVTPKKQTSSSETRENSMNTNESSNMGHAAPKKSDQKIFEDITSGEASSPEPRRSSRVPKMNERLLNYLSREEGTIISLLFSEKKSTAKGSAELPYDLNSSPRNSTNRNYTNGSSCSNSSERISREKGEKPVCDLEPRRSSREPKTSEKLFNYLYSAEEKGEKPVCDLEPRRSNREPKTSEKLFNYLYSAEGKHRKLPVKSQITTSLLPQQPSFQRISAEMKISPIGDLSPRRSSRAPKTNERLLNYLHAGDRKSKRSSEVSGTDSQTSPIITNIERGKVDRSNSSNSTNGEKFSEEDCPNKEPRRSSRTPKTNEKLRNYLHPKEDLEVASTSNGEPMFTKCQKRLLKESSDSGSSFKNICIKSNSPKEKKIMSNHKLKQCSIILTNIENEKTHKSKTSVATSIESIFKDEPLPIPYNAWLLCLGHHSSQFGYSADTEKIAAKVYIENQGLYLGTHQILLNEYKRQLKEYFSNIPKSLRSKYLELRANHVWNCFNEDIFGDIIGSSFITENNFLIVKSSNIDQIKVSGNKLISDSDSDNIHKSDKTQRKTKKRKGNSYIRKSQKDIYKNSLLIESDSSIKEDDNDSETSSNKDIDNINVIRCFSRKSTKRKLSNVFVQQQVRKNLHHEIKGDKS